MNPPHPPADQNALASSDPSEALAIECEEVRTNFWDYLDGRCSSGFAARIGAHASACQPCLQFLQVEERFLSALGDYGTQARAPASLHERVRAAIATARRENGRKSR